MTRPAPTASCALVALLVALAVFGGGSAPASAQSTATIAGTQIAPDDVSLRIALRPNGTAEWEVEYRVRLDDENKTEAFESVRSDIRANSSPYVSEFGSRMDATASTAENSTGRSMSVENVDVSTSRQQLPQEYGIITYSFVWTNFSAVEDGEIRAGDALAGFFLDGETSLLVTWPEGYEAESVAPDPNDRRARTVVWHGPIDFGPGEPTLVLTETPPAGSPSATATQAPADGEGSSENGVAVLGALALLAVGIVGGGGWTLYRRYGGEETPRDAESSGRASVPGGDAPDTPRETDDSEEPDESTTGDVSAGGAGGADDATDDADEMPWEDELLSNEECVLALVEHEGGRLKQQEVAQTLEWTDAKTSQVVRKMRDAGTLEAFRLGRENVLVLPEESDDGPGVE